VVGKVVHWAWSYFKFDKAKSMIDEPQSDSTHNQSDQDLEKGGASPKTADPTKAAEKQGQTKQYRNYSQYVVRPLKAFGRGTLKVVNWLDAKGGFVTAVATVAIAVLTGFYVHYSRAQWKAMRDQLPELRRSADAANASIRTSQQSYVTVGRQDGTVAEIVWPKNPEGKAGIVVYFRNNGHLPAKFNWGTKNEIIAVLPNDPNIPVGSPKASSSGGYEVRTNNVFKPMWKARNRKTGIFMASQVTMIGGDSLYAGNLWEVPKDRMVQMQNSALWTVGTFEYCDAFHNYVCRTFALIYRREPYNRFMVVSEDECLGSENAYIHPDPDLEFLSPCATGTEREETRIFQGMKGWVYPGR
jgi:hypothetical protein